ncbi:MAG: lactonase family protein [Acidobacteriota bacterium]|nr:lactonase family protein [Acidobacteriota bacterium]
MTTRRHFLSLLAVSAAARGQKFTLPHLRKKPAPAAPLPAAGFVYFGTDTDRHVSRGIYRARFDTATGKLSPAELVAETPRPVFLAVAATPGSPGSPAQRRLYAVNELNEALSKVSAFLIDPATGDLRLINQVSSGGAGPCFISVDATGHSAFVANYSGSSIASYRILPDGSLSQPVERIDFKDPKFGKRGPNAARQDLPHPHSVHLSPDDRFLLVNDLGSDEISVFAVHPETARLGPPALFSNARPGSGPRHLAFHPNGRWVYSINELDSTLDLFLWNTTSSRTAPQGLLVKAGPPVKTISPGFAANRNTAAEVAVSPDGHFLYASNRGEDSLAVFSLAAIDGAPTLIQRISCGGRTPRHFTLSPDAHWILCGNQDSATVAVFRRDPVSGRLTGPTQTIPLDSPMIALFV